MCYEPLSRSWAGLGWESLPSLPPPRPHMHTAKHLKRKHLKTAKNTTALPPSPEIPPTQK